MKLKWFHTFCISNWNLKWFQCINILCIVMSLKKFLIEIRVMSAKIYFNPILVKIEPLLWSCRLTLRLKFSFILILSVATNFKSPRRSMITCVYNPCDIDIRFVLFFTSRVIERDSFELSLHYFIKSSEKILVWKRCRRL